MKSKETKQMTFEEVCYRILMENNVQPLPELEEVSKLNSTYELYVKYIKKDKR